MGFQERPYYRENQPYRGGGMPHFHLPKLTPVVKWLLIINVGAFILQIIGQRQASGLMAPFVERWFALLSDTPFQVWRLVTFQFLHDPGNLLHLFGNMLGLYFLGSAMERHWGPKRFLRFYLTCGAAGGAVFLVFSRLVPSLGGVLIGASGGVLGLLVVVAILFPHWVVFVLLFPVPIRWAAVGFTVLYLFNVMAGGWNAGGDLCHLGGMATGFVWVAGRPYFDAFLRRHRQSSAQRQFQHNRQLQYEVDRILAKVHDHGIQSLTRREKKTLQEATDRERGSRV